MIKRDKFALDRHQRFTEKTGTNEDDVEGKPAHLKLSRNFGEKPDLGTSWPGGISWKRGRGKEALAKSSGGGPK